MYINHNGMARKVADTLTGHYARLATSTERLSSGMRINHAADDAAGLAVSELMRADIAALNQGVRNANDAISMIQTADGALGVIDEKLTRMKELAEQASTGTYDSVQRLMIDSEFQAMGSEITRIARATDFNGIKLLDGSLSGGTGGGATGPVVTTTTARWDFNDASDASGNGHTLATNGLVSFNGGRMETQEGFIGNASVTLDLSGNPGLGFALTFSTIRAAGTGAGAQTELFSFGGLTAVAYTTGELEVSLNGQSVGSAVGAVSDGGTNSLEVRIEEDKALHVILNGADIGSIADAVLGGPGQLVIGNTTAFGYATSFDSFTITEGEQQQQAAEPGGVLIHFGPSNDSAEDYYVIRGSDATLAGLGLAGVNVQTQERAQTTLNRIGDAQARHAEIRSYLGAMQNRLENTVTNLTIQAENLQNSESRIRDANIATEMTDFVRNQVLTQSAVAMLSQANSMPQMTMQLIG